MRSSMLSQFPSLFATCGGPKGGDVQDGGDDGLVLGRELDAQDLGDDDPQPVGDLLGRAGLALHADMYTMFDNVRNGECITQGSLHKTATTIAFSLHQESMVFGNIERPMEKDQICRWKHLVCKDP